MTSFSYPSGRTIDYTRYGSGRIETAATTYYLTTGNLVNNLSYNPFGPAKGLGTGSGGTVSNTTNESGDLEIINPGEQMEQVYTYDDNRNLLSVVAANTPWYDRDFDYDALNRLTSAEGIFGIIDFAYDDVGNRTTRTVDSQADTYTYQPGTGRLAQITGVNPATFSYDANGNITDIDSKTFVYNQNNRLIRVEEGLDILGEYTYNGLSQRQIKEVDGVATVFHYDFDGNIIAESQADGTMTVEYLHVDQSRMAMVDIASGALYYFHNNYLGTPVLMTDSTGTVVWEGDYKPFGEAGVHPSSTVVNNFRFAGQYFDSETGLHYNYHRYYDPKTGRYLTPDPIGLRGGINLFAYVNNNPIKRVDPFGLAEYFVMWTTSAIADPTGVAGGMKVEGTIISFELDKYNRHPARNFEGTFPGASFPFPVSKTSNVAIFKDDLPLPDFYNIEGNSLIMTSVSIMIGQYGFSGPAHISFGNLLMQSMETECGIDFSAGAAWPGSISLKPGNELRYYPEFVQSIIEKYELK